MIRATGTGGHVVIVGGASGMGLALAECCLREGSQVTIVGRTRERLMAARAGLGTPAALAVEVADISREQEVAELMVRLGAADHIVTTAADIRDAYRLLPELTVEAVQRVLDSKLIGPLLLAKHGAPILPSHGSITFTSGIAAYRPASRGAAVAAANGALESLAYALAIELAPIRVNVVSPGWVDSRIWRDVAGDAKAATLSAMADRLPAGRIGRPHDIADAITYLMGNGFTTGTVLHVDGGHRLV